MFVIQNRIHFIIIIIDFVHFLETGYGSVIFFLMPVSTMLVINLILFVLTAIHCSKIKSELNKFKRTDEKSQRFQVDKEK